MRFRQPKNAVHDCRMPLKTPVETAQASEGQHNPENDKNKAASGETAQSFSWRRRLNPPVHVRRFSLA
jgi:hypothetical protein